MLSFIRVGNIVYYKNSTYWGNNINIDSDPISIPFSEIILDAILTDTQLLYKEYSLVCIDKFEIDNDRLLISGHITLLNKIIYQKLINIDDFSLLDDGNDNLFNHLFTILYIHVSMERIPNN